MDNLTQRAKEKDADVMLTAGLAVAAGSRWNEGIRERWQVEEPVGERRQYDLSDLYDRSRERLGFGQGCLCGIKELVRL